MFLQRGHLDGKKNTWKTAWHHYVRKMKVETTMSSLSHWSEEPAKIKKPANNRCWRGCGERETLLHCWWECKLIQPLWRTVWRFLKKLGIKLPWWWWWWCLIVSDSCHHRTVAHQAFLSMGFLRQEYWSELPFLSPGDLHDPGIKPSSPSSCIAVGFFTHWAIGEAPKLPEARKQQNQSRNNVMQRSRFLETLNKIKKI